MNVSKQTSTKRLAPYYLFFAFLILFVSQGNAQCPSSPFEGVHVVQENENLFRIAMNNNVSVDDICMWNSILATDALYKCQELVVSAALTNPAPVGSVSSSGTLASSLAPAKKQSGRWHTVRQGETVPQLAHLYGYTEDRFRAFNKLAAWKKIKPGAILRSTECVCKETAAAPAAQPKTTSPATTQTTSTPSPATVSDSRGYMTLNESAMIDEINLMRTNPKAYVKYIREYVADYKESWGMSISSQAVNSLIRDLEKLPQLSPLRPHQCLYELAKKQGDYLKKTGRFQHTDAKGVGPWSRTMNACPQVKLSTSKGRSGMLIGNENLVAGHDNARQSVIDLLIDDGINPPGHRETLLGTEWRYIACYNYGTVNQMQNHWVQNFGR